MLFSNPRISQYLNSFVLILLMVFCEAGFSARGWAGMHAAKDPEVDNAIGRASALYKEFKTRDAVAELQRALKIDPNNLEALVWLARAQIDLGDLIPQTEADWQARRKQRYQTAEGYAQKAAKIDPKSTWAHFYAAVAMAKSAALSSVKEQIALAHEIRDRVDKSIEMDPSNGFAYHVLGVWHRRMAEIGGAKRFMALVFLQGSVPKGSMGKSVQYLKKALTYNPRVITHHLELAKTYQALGKTELAKEHLQKVETLPVQFSDDGAHKQEAKGLLEEIQ